MDTQLSSGSVVTRSAVNGLQGHHGAADKNSWTALAAYGGGSWTALAAYGGAQAQLSGLILAKQAGWKKCLGIGIALGGICSVDKEAAACVLSSWGQGHGTEYAFRYPKSRLRVMGNTTTTPGILHEEDEPAMTKDNLNYKREISTASHHKDALGRPLVIFDRWKILQSDLDDKKDKMDSVFNELDLNNHQNSTSQTEYSYQSVISDDSDTGIDNSTGELSTSGNVIKPPGEQTQRTSNRNAANSQSPFVKKPRPNSLAILSRSHDCINTLGDDQEVNGANGGFSYLSTASTSSGTPLNNQCRAASADTLLQKPAGLQQRRNQRPTSLQIPSITHLPLEAARTSNPYTSNTQELSFTRHTPPARQRSYSMPGSTNMEIAPRRPVPSHSLDEAVSLLSKKKIGRVEIDEQSLLHRAADAGHLKLAKKCLQAGCTVTKRLDSLIGTTALHCAARADKNSAQITKLLLEMGMDVNTENDLGETAIFSAIIHKNMETVDLLVEYGCDINSVWQESTPLYLMLYNKNLESTLKVIQNGAQITQLPDTIRQPLHAVLDLCHSQPINYQTMQLLKHTVQADGNVVDHLLDYKPNQPGCSEQDIVYHIYRMERGPAQNEGKLLVRSLVKLGYMPSRGELSTMGQSDDDYDYLYSYIKQGPSPLKDLCIRTIRKSCPVNVTYSMNALGSQIEEKEQMQILLQPAPLPENEYENVQVFRRTKDGRKSKHKSIKTIMSGLSRRFSKKYHGSGEDDPGASSLSLPNKELSKRTSASLPSAIDQKTKNKPKIQPKPKFVKKDGQKSNTMTAVADIVKRYSSSDGLELLSSDECAADDQRSSTLAMDNPVYQNTEDLGDNKLVSRIEINNDSGIADYEDSRPDDHFVVKFSDDNGYRKADSAQLTPMRMHAPDMNSGTGFAVYKGSIHIDDDNDNM